MFEFTTAVVVAVAFGLVLGIGPAIVVALLSGGLSLLDRPIPRTSAAIVGLVLAAGNGYIVGVGDAVAGGTVSAVIALAAGTVPVVALSLYAHGLAETVAADLPADASRQIRRERGLSADAIDAVDGMGWVTIRAAGRVREIDGYPPLEPDLRTTLENGTWRLPADLPLSALESRLEARLRTTHDLTAVSASIDERGRATITAAPPSNAVASRVPEGWRAVAVWALLPTGLAPGEEVLVYPGEEREPVTGQVVDVDIDPVRGNAGQADAPSSSGRSGRSATPGGEGRVTVAVPTAEASVLLAHDWARIVATSGEPDADLEAFATLERAGCSVRSLSVGRPGTALASDRIDSILEDVHLLVARRGDDHDLTDAASVVDDRWTVEPEPSTLEAGDEAFVVGDEALLARLGGNEPNAGSDAGSARSPEPPNERTGVEAR